MPDRRYSLTVRRRWRVAKAVDVDYTGRSTDPVSIEEGIRAALEQVDGIVSCSYARRGDQDTLDITAEASESRDDETRLNERLVDQLIARIDDALRIFGDEYERRGPVHLRHDLAFLITRHGRTRSVEGTAPTESQITFTLGRRLRAATAEKARLARHVRAAVDDYRDARHRKPLANINIERRGDALVIASVEAPQDAESLARALLGADLAPHTPRRRIDHFVPSPTKYWSVGTLALLAVSLGAAFLVLSASWLIAFAAATATVAGMSLYCAHRAGALLAPVVVGLAIPALIVAYAITYGFAMLGRHPAISTTTSGHLVDPVMLSFAIATTAGFLDFGLKDLWVRIAAYSEMLLVVSVAGSSAYSLARSAWNRLSELLGPRG